VIFITPRENFVLALRSLLLIAQKQCNPYHRIEYCGVSPRFSRPFHKVINNCVENLTEIKFLLLQFGIVRATSLRRSLLTGLVPRCTILFCTLFYDGSNAQHARRSIFLSANVLGKPFGAPASLRAERAGHRHSSGFGSDDCGTH
jgi:hypothetical protein